MKDDEIISLFFARDENAISELSNKYHSYCYKIAWNLLVINAYKTDNLDMETCATFQFDFCFSQ